MFPISLTSDNSIPSLTFTKAELAYSLAFLMSDVSPLDNTTRVDMVEIRHYLNQIKDRVAKSIADGSLERALKPSADQGGNHTGAHPKSSPAPSMSELRAKFPTLTEEEIAEVLEKARKEAQVERAAEIPATTPSFVVKGSPAVAAERPPSTKAAKYRENSKRFSDLLGQF